MNDLIKTYIAVFQQIERIADYDTCLSEFKEALKEQKCDPVVYQNIVSRTKYNKNQFSDVSNNDSMKRVRDNLIDYLEVLLLTDEAGLPQTITNLHDYLRHFYSFLEAFREIEPHKSATLNTGILQAVEVNNEYDLQHLLYAALKPLWQDTRREVVQDTGYASVRVDLIIESAEAAIELKCTRKTLSIKELTEQIAADIYHYDQKYLFIYIYDKEKVIKDKEAFEKAYSRKTAEQQIYTIVLQPVCL